MNRRQFNTFAAASLGSLLTHRLWAEQALASAAPHKFYFALVADSHIIDTFYVKGSENASKTMKASSSPHRASSPPATSSTRSTPPSSRSS